MTFVGDCFDAGGTTFSITTDDASVLQRVSDALTDLRVPSGRAPDVDFTIVHRPGKSNPWAVYRDGNLCVAAVSDHKLLPYLVAQISRLVFEGHPDRTPLHAAAVTFDDAAVVIAGDSEVGKSTLAGWLTLNGWGFLTDEVALVDAGTLLVHPFWRPVGVRRPGPLDGLLPSSGTDDDREVLIPASRLGQLARSTPLTLILFPTVELGSHAGFERTSPAAALTELVRHCSDIRIRGEERFMQLATIARRVPSVRFRYGDLGRADEALRLYLSHRTGL